MDAARPEGHHPWMIVTPLPWRGGVQVDRRDTDRAVRVSAHPEPQIVSLSMWRGDVCIATHQMTPSDASQLIAMLANAITATVEPAAPLAADAS
jgi:hypothetical protein